MNIYISPDELKRKANEIAVCASTMNENMIRIQNLILGLGVEWQGNAEKAFTAKLLFVKQQFDFLYDSFIDLSETITVIAGEYEETERQLLSKMEV